jgi:hypothetical protein
MDDDAEILAEIRQRMEARGEADATDEELREALRLTLIALAEEFAPQGARTSRPSATGRSGYPP